MKSSFVLRFTALVLLLSAVIEGNAKDKPRQYYQIRIYHLKDAAQEQRLDSFLRDAYLPALHRQGIARVGVFKPIPAEAKEKLVYLLVPFKSDKQILNLEAKLSEDKTYQQAGSSYINTIYTSPVYERMENILLNSMPGTSFATHSYDSTAGSRIFELRSYEGASETIFRNKVDMFTKGGEIGIFSRLGFKPIFYGEVIAGGKMPNLMYMTSFENKAARDKHWDAFGKDPEWKVLSAKPEYQNNVSHIDTWLLHPAAYSDL